MGAADVIPGVSGGTIALIVGIYRELIHTLKSLHLRWIRPLCNLVLLRNPRENTNQLKRHFREMNGPFLLILGAGILTAIIIGSTFIPGLLADYPMAVKALFFGLILSSAWIPFRIVDDFELSALPFSVLVGVLLAVIGFYVSNPNLRLAGSVQWVEVQSSGQQFKTILESVPASKPAHRVYWSPQNQSFRKTLRRRDATLAQDLQGLRSRTIDSVSPKEALKARSEPYEKITVPEGSTVMVPRLSYWYVFVAGTLAVSAMILPGISGSYILLILGSYFFVLNSVKGFLDGLLSGGFNSGQILIITLFTGGAVIGLLLFTRLLDYLLTRWELLTAAGLSGLMLGCLRGVWPFQRTLDGTVHLMLPETITPGVSVAFGMFLVGFLIVLGLNLVPTPEEGTEPRFEP